MTQFEKGEAAFNAGEPCGKGKSERWVRGWEVGRFKYLTNLTPTTKNVKPRDEWEHDPAVIQRWYSGVRRKQWEKAAKLAAKLVTGKSMTGKERDELITLASEVERPQSTKRFTGTDFRLGSLYALAMVRPRFLRGQALTLTQRRALDRLNLLNFAVTTTHKDLYTLRVIQKHGDSDVHSWFVKQLKKKAGTKKPALGREQQQAVALCLKHLGPVEKLPVWTQAVLKSFNILRTKAAFKGKIPLGEALDWVVEYKHTWHMNIGAYRAGTFVLQAAARNRKQGPTEVTYFDCLKDYAIKQYGAELGNELAQRTVIHVLEYAKRDMRKRRYHHETDKRKLRRQKKAGRGKKANRFLKFSTSSRTKYWRWLVSQLTVVRKRRDADVSEILVLAYIDGIGNRTTGQRRTPKASVEYHGKGQWWFSTPQLPHA